MSALNPHSIQLTYISANTPLAKTISTTGTDPYPNIRNVTSTTETVHTLDQMYASLTTNAARGNALLKGPLLRTLNNESRMGLSDKAAPTRWMCLDFDGYQGSLSHALIELGLENVSYIIQYSASQGIKPGVSAHLFFLLHDMIAPSQLKLWLIYQNLNTLAFKQFLSLNKASTAIKFQLDVVTADNSRILYIAPPAFVPPAVDPMANTPRFQLVLGSVHAAKLKNLDQATEPSVRTAIMDFIRRNQPTGSNYKVNYKFDKTLNEVMAVPSSPSRVTGIKDDPTSDFIYVNLNGGDSWGYYFRRDDPTYLMNFKGEPLYRMVDIAPELLPTPKINCFQEYDSEGFLTVLGDQYHCHRNYRMMQGLCADNGQTAPKIQDLLVCKLGYVPTGPYGLIPGVVHSNGMMKGTRIFNTFKMPKFEVAGVGAARNFPTIDAIITHVCVDEPTKLHFLNWLAFVMQKRAKAKTAWVFTGVQGTGKGLIVDTILAGIFGKENIVTVQKEVLEAPFNPYVHNNLFVVYDEAKFDILTDKRIDHKLKILITSDEIQVNDKHARHRMATSYSNVLITSNEYDVLHINNSDRRHHIAPRQEVPLRKVMPHIEARVAGIPAELPHFAEFLKQYPLDIPKVTTIMDTIHRREFIDHGKWGMEVVADIVLRGDRKLMRSLVIEELQCVADMSTQLQYNELYAAKLNEVISTFTKGDLWVIARVANPKTPGNPRQFLKQLALVGIYPNDATQLITTEWKSI